MSKPRMNLVGMTVVAALTAAAATGCTASSPVSTSPTPAPTPIVTATPTPTPSAEQLEATAVLERFWVTYDQVFRKEADPNDLYKVARGPIMEDFLQSYNQTQGLGLTRQGSVDRFNLTPAEPTTQDGRTTVLVAACIDQTQLQMVDKNGEDKMSASSKTVTASEMTVQHWEGEGWFVTEGSPGTQGCTR